MNILQKILALPTGIYVPLLSNIGVLSVTSTLPVGNDTDRHIEVNLVGFNNAVTKDWTSRSNLNSKLYVRLPLYLEGELVRKTRSPSFSTPSLENFVADFPRYAEAIAVALADLESLEQDDYVWRTNEEIRTGYGMKPKVEIPTYYEVTSMFYIHNQPEKTS